MLKAKIKLNYPDDFALAITFALKSFIRNFVNLMLK